MNVHLGSEPPKVNLNRIAYFLLLFLTSILALFLLSKARQHGLDLSSFMTGDSLTLAHVLGLSLLLVVSKRIRLKKERQFFSLEKGMLHYKLSTDKQPHKIPLAAIESLACHPQSADIYLKNGDHIRLDLSELHDTENRGIKKVLQNLHEEGGN
ncbi:MAG: hypothetical protein AAFY71_02505 [Bacteroidota bacterium]